EISVRGLGYRQLISPERLLLGPWGSPRARSRENTHKRVARLPRPGAAGPPPQAEGRGPKLERQHWRHQIRPCSAHVVTHPFPPIGRRPKARCAPSAARSCPPQGWRDACSRRSEERRVGKEARAG